MGEEAELLEDPAYWMGHFQPKVSAQSTEISVDSEPESEPLSPSPDSKDWWSEGYKAGRKYLYGIKEEKPDF